MLWVEDGNCYRPFGRGPCSSGQILVDHPQGARCEYKKKSLNRKYQILFPTERSKDYWKLPVDDDFSSFSEDERECLSQEKVYWPATASCYNLLTQVDIVKQAYASLRSLV